MRNIHIIHASRGRASQAEATYGNWVKQLKQGDSYTVAVESDQWLDYKNMPCLVVGGGTAIKAFNETAYLLHESWNQNDIIIGISDDFNEPCNLELIREHCPHDGVLKTFDGIQEYIVTLPIMGLEYYWSKGYIYPPQYKHMFADTHLTHEAELGGKLSIINDIVIKHNHYSIGGCEKDSLNERNDKTFNEGMQTYLAWAKSQEKQLISKESLSLRNWLKNK